MQLVTLGRLELLGATFTRIKPLLLLTYVTLEGARDRRYLAELFWPDATDPLNSLAAAIKQLRQYAPGVVESSYTHVSSTVACDARTFLEVAETGHGEKALELYQGPFLSGIQLPGWSVELEDWVYCTREFLAGQARTLWLLSGEKLGAQGDFSRAAKCAELAYLLLGATELNPNEMTRIQVLLTAGNSPHLSGFKKSAHEYGIEHTFSPAAAREQLQRPYTSTLPRRGTAFVGRDAELVEVANHITKPDCSLLTLTGPGGVGKSRLAVRVAQDLGARHDLEVYFVALEALNDDSLIPASIAKTLGLSLQGSDTPLLQVEWHLGKRSVLLILDNFEHLLAGTGVVTHLLRACSNLKLLITSRERLNLEEEWVWTLEGFAIPNPLSHLPDYAHHDALRLFEDRAKRARLSFMLTPQELPHVVTICKQVGGLPLGIELAAAWVKLLSCEEIAREIERTIDFLASTNRNAAERHKSIRVVFERSWQLLTPQEQEVSRQLSVFQGGFKREAAAEVVGATIPVLASLVDKSLLRITNNSRYDCHPLIKQYLKEKLNKHPKVQTYIQEKHSQYYLHLIEIQGAELSGPKQHEVLLTITEELENSRIAWEWALRNRQVADLRRCSTPLSLFYELSGRFQEAMAIFGKAIAALENLGYEATLSLVLLEHSCHCYRLGLFSQATQAAARGLDLAEAIGDEDLTARNLNSLGQIAWQVGDFSASRQYFEKALALAEAHNNVVLTAILDRSVGWVESIKGNYDEAKKRLEASLALFQSIGMPHEIIDNLNALGHLHVNSGRPSEAQPFFEEGLKLAQDIGAQVMVPHLLSGAGLASFELKRYIEAKVLLKRSLNESANELARAWVLVVLGRTHAAIKEYALASECIKQALTMSWSARQLPEVLDALAALSELYFVQGHESRAATLSQVVSTNSATTGYSRSLAHKLLEKLSVSKNETFGGKVGLHSIKPLEEVVREVLR